MATEKDKVIAELCGIDRLATGDKLPDKSTYAWLAIVDRIWYAARADAIEECAKIAENEKVDAADTGAESDEAYNAACEHIAFAIRRSLSRKQEEPR